MIEMTFHGANCTVEEPGDGRRHLVAIDPDSGVVARLMFPIEVAPQIAAMLNGTSLVVAPPQAIGLAEVKH